MRRLLASAWDRYWWILLPLLIPLMVVRAFWRATPADWRELWDFTRAYVLPFALLVALVVGAVTAIVGACKERRPAANPEATARQITLAEDFGRERVLRLLQFTDLMLEREVAEDADEYEEGMTSLEREDARLGEIMMKKVEALRRVGGELSAKRMHAIVYASERKALADAGKLRPGK